MMHRCKCRKGCNTGKCGCKKNSSHCSPGCYCINYTNIPNTQKVDDLSESESENDDNSNSDEELETEIITDSDIMYFTL